MRTCTKCQETKPESEFPPPKPSNNMRPQRRCRECVNEVECVRRARSDGAYAAYLREYRAANKTYRRKWNLWSKYRITPEQYDDMLSRQGGVCAICNGSQDRVSRDGTRWFDVDHNHATGRVRGLLCHSCNTGIGKLRDSQEVLLAAVAYLQRDQLVLVVEDTGPA